MRTVIVVAMFLFFGVRVNADPIREIFGRMPIDFPFCVEQKKLDAVAEVHLYVSENDGKTWKVIAKAKPSAKFVRSPPRDAVYSFSLMTVYRDGHSEPANEAQLTIDAQLRLNGVAEASGSSD